MEGNYLCRQNVPLQEMADDVLGSTECVAKDIVIIPPEQGNSYATNVVEDETPSTEMIYFQKVLQKL